MRIVLVGGGTGGHFYPLMAIAEGLHAQAQVSGRTLPELYYMGPEPYNETALSKRMITFVHCPAGKRRRYRSILNIFDSFVTLWGIVVAIGKLYQLYPDVIMSKGGYTSVPVVIAGWLLRIPIVIHESDAAPGRANKMAARFARYIAISYPDTAELFPPEKTALTGIPIRTTLEVTSRQLENRDVSEYPTLLVLGGSQGAERVNRLILQTLDELLPNYTVVHQTGSAALASTKAATETLIKDTTLRARYHAVGFLEADALHEKLTESVLVIARAGSGTIHEIALYGKPSILIPIPEDISHDQRTNAYAYARTGAATVLEEKNLKDGLLNAEIKRIIHDQTLYQRMGEAARAFAPKNARETIAAALIEIGEEHE